MTHRCVLHIGMPKTGSSSIQESLFHGLREPRFRYFSFGEVNAGRALQTLFGGSNHYNQKLGLTPDEIEKLRGQLFSRLQRCVTTTQADGRALILSAEAMWLMSREELQRLHDYLVQQEFEIEVIVYLRPWKSWIESFFQEKVKQGVATLELLSTTERKRVDLLNNLNVLDEIFGADRVTPVLFSAERFPDNCVVSDCCQRVGIPWDRRKTRRVNDGLSLDALKLLFAYRQFGGGYGEGIKRVIQNEILFRRLAELPGRPLRFHSSLLEPAIEEFLPQVPAIERRLGAPFREDLRRDDSGGAIRTESQLREFSPESLTWLSQVTGLPRVHSESGDAAARAVSEQMHSLCEHPSLTSRIRWHGMILSRRIAQFRFGV